MGTEKILRSRKISKTIIQKQHYFRSNHWFQQCCFWSNWRIPLKKSCFTVERK